MKLLLVLLLEMLFVIPVGTLLTSVVVAAPAPLVENAADNNAYNAYGDLPLSFIENRGQVDGRVQFYERGRGHATFFTGNSVKIVLMQNNIKADKRTSVPAVSEEKGRKLITEALSLNFVGSNRGARIIHREPLPGYVNYFMGRQGSNWLTSIPTYKTLTYENIYKNVDIKFYGKGHSLEHDIIVRAGGDVPSLRFGLNGIKDAKITRDGNLVISLEKGNIIEKKPFVYQVVNGRKVTVEGNFRIIKDNGGAFVYGYDVASYDKKRDLVIDPVLSYSTYLGGIGTDWGDAVAVDNTGAAYVTGFTTSFNFPVNSGIQGAFGGSTDAFITKINPAGTAMVYSTYLGGTSDDFGKGIAVDSTGSAYVTGYTLSTDFPLVTPIQGLKGGFNDAFVAKINPAGTAIVYSTFLGGTDHDYGYGIAVDGTGAAIVVGSTYSVNFPTANAQKATISGMEDFFVTKINPAGTAYSYSTYLGGNGLEDGYGIDLDGTGNAFVTGRTSSFDFPLVNPILTTFGGGGWDAFVTKLNSGGSALLYSTYLGGSNDDTGYGIAVDSSSHAYVTGSTGSVDFPVVSPIQGMGNILSPDAFVSKVNTTGNTLVYSTYLGGSSTDEGFGIALDSSDNAYVTGWTLSSDFPLSNAVQGTYGGIFDAFVTTIDFTGTSLLYSTYLGGSGGEMGNAIAVDSTGAAFVTGDTFSTDFPTASPLQGLNNSGTDAFITKIIGTPPPVVTLAITPDAVSIARGSTLGYTVTAVNTTTANQCFQYWENVTLPNGSTYPTTGALFGPINICLNAGASKTAHLTHGVPMGAPVGAYIFNAFVGTNPTPVTSEATFNFNVTAFNPATSNPRSSWRLIENGFRK